MPYKKHKRGEKLQESHPYGDPEGSYHRPVHPSGKAKRVHNHRMVSGGGKITDYIKKER
jgi:hypothetical protein